MTDKISCAPRVNIGHRGAGHVKPHNSHEGFQYVADNAIALDISAIETDLFFTKVFAPHPRMLLVLNHNELQDNRVLLLHGLPDIIPTDTTGVFEPSWINDKVLEGWLWFGE